MGRWGGTEARLIGNRVFFFVSSGARSPQFEIWRSEESDWATAELVRTDFYNASAFDAAHGVTSSTYKNTFVPHLYEDGTAQVKALVSCRPSASQWWMFYAETVRTPIGD